MTSAMPETTWLPGRTRQDLGMQPDPKGVEALSHRMGLGPFRSTSTIPAKSRKHRRSR